MGLENQGANTQLALILGMFLCALLITHGLAALHRRGRCLWMSEVGLTMLFGVVISLFKEDFTSNRYLGEDVFSSGFFYSCAPASDHFELRIFNEEEEFLFERDSDPHIYSVWHGSERTPVCCLYLHGHHAPHLDQRKHAELARVSHLRGPDCPRGPSRHPCYYEACER
eukprot:Rmarinus@m.1997